MWQLPLTAGDSLTLPAVGGAAAAVAAAAAVVLVSLSLAASVVTLPLLLHVPHVASVAQCCCWRWLKLSTRPTSMTIVSQLYWQPDEPVCIASGCSPEIMARTNFNFIALS